MLLGNTCLRGNCAIARGNLLNGWLLFVLDLLVDIWPYNAGKYVLFNKVKQGAYNRSENFFLLIFFYDYYFNEEEITGIL